MKYTIFMDQKSQYSENKYTTQSNLQVQCNPYQATSGIFHRARTNNWRRKWQPTPVFLPGESHGWGSLVGCRLWGRTELDATEVT